MERIIELIGIFLSAIISLVLAMFGLPLEIWIISGLGVLFCGLYWFYIMKLVS